jgi:hypothetical protein
MSTVPAPEVISNECTEEFEQIFREHSQWVYRTAYAVTGNAEDAEDVLQTIFLRIYERDQRVAVSGARMCSSVAIPARRSQMLLRSERDPAARSPGRGPPEAEVVPVGGPPL